MTPIGIRSPFFGRTILAGTPAADLADLSAAFTASACSLIIELVAGRIMAPLIGVSLYTWTSIIGVVLAGISLGNFLGGKLADRYASRRALGVLFFLSGLASLSVLLTARRVRRLQGPCLTSAHGAHRAAHCRDLLPAQLCSGHDLADARQADVT